MSQHDHPLLLQEPCRVPGHGTELSILMPCLNEADTIEVCVTKAISFLRRHGVVGEVLVADNGSTDGSTDIATRAGARVVPIAERGYGAALLGGIKEAHGKFVIMGDSDDSYDFSALESFLDRLRAGDELVVGNRFRGGIEPGAMPLLHKYLGTPILSFLGKLFFRAPTGDFNCGLRGFSREAILRLRLVGPGMEFASEMIVKAALGRLKISEVPVRLSRDGRSRAPHLKPWRDGWRHLRFLLLHSPEWLFFYPGAVLMGLGLIGMLVLLPGSLRITPTTELGVHTLLSASFMVLIGTQLISFWLLARRYAALEGFLPPQRFAGATEGLGLERVLQVTFVLLVLGAAGFGWALWYWASHDFGPIAYSGVIRVLIVSLLAIAVAIQIAASAFLASVFSSSIRRPGVDR